MPDILDEAAAAPEPIAETVALPPSTRELLLSKSVSAALMWLALPVLGEQVLNLLVGLVDIYLAGTLSKEATAGVGLAATVAWLVWLLFSFVAVGATALVSRHVGESRPREADHICNQAVAAGAIMGLAAFLLVQGLAPILPRLLGWDAESTAVVVRYLRIESCGYLLVSFSAVGFACLRGAGDTRTPLYVMLVVNATNILVSAGLTFGYGPLPAWGVTGIALGTVSARVLGGLIVLIVLSRGRSGLRLRRAEMRFRRASQQRLLRIGLPAGLDGLLMWTANFGFVAVISKLGTGENQSAIMAAHFVGIRIEALSYLPAFAWATAAATLVGQSLGAGRPDRAVRSGHLAAFQSAAICFIMGVAYYMFAEPIYLLFNRSEDAQRVLEVGVPALKLLAFFQIPCALMIVYPNALRGAGDTRYPLLFTASSMWLVRIPVAYLGGIVLQGGLVGAWVGMCADMTLRAILNGVRFSRERWTRIKI